MKESRFVKTKIAAGYVILIAVCILSVGYVYRTVVRYGAPDGSYALLQSKRRAVNEVLYHLYQAESYGQLMIAGYQSCEALYRRELRAVRGCIDSLRRFDGSVDSLQTMRLDSIVRLLADKEQRTMSLRRSIRSGGTASLLDKNIRALIEGPENPAAEGGLPADSLARGDSLRPGDSLRREVPWRPAPSDSLLHADARMRADSLSGADPPRTDSLPGVLSAAAHPLREAARPAALRGDTLPRPRIVHSDTVAVPHPKRRFFRRLADLFSPPKDAADVVISRREILVDTLPAPAGPDPGAIRDTIALVLRALQDSVTSERLDIYDTAWREGLRLRYSNDLVNAKIYRLILDFEEEETQYLMARIDAREALRSRSSHLLGGVAAGAVALMLLFVAISWRDINRSNRYRRALERANRDNEALLAAREQLMLAITHDIKAPLGSVMGYIDLLSRLTGDKRQQLYLANMKASADHLLALVKSLLDFYRLDAHKMEVEPVVFNPAQLFDTIRTGFAAAAAAKGLDLRLEAAAGADREVVGDAFRIRQIADNLVSNALKFTDRGSVTLRVDVADGQLTFSVRDTGRGIAPEERERIFAEFVRLRSARGVDGFGLGLSIVDRLVKLLGGSLSLDSTPGRGSRFLVTIPVGRVSGKSRTVAPPSGETAPAAPATSAAPAPLPAYRVLLVDDDPLQLEMVAAMCRRAGLVAECCQYPEYAGRLVAENRFDAVVTDIQMPSCDGFRVLEEVHRAAPGLPVVAVSARGDLGAGEFAARGFAACLRKPFTYGELVEALRTAAGAVADADAEAAPAPETPAAEETGAATGGWNLAALTAFAGDDHEAARSILDSFVEQTTANREALCAALDAGDDAAAKAQAHKMLPLLTMLGDDGVATVLRQAETAPGAFDAPLREALRGAAADIARGLARIATGPAADPTADPAANPTADSTADPAAEKAAENGARTE
ncbi:hybrid sensor histidine kinase/response regulator [uncultured Alistipes sp.]|uniref:hybrid sensor histidine kinase/response regulator n=1 Tax=uncultured Alistipes sp. TaxID=538949 RepID=UPI002617401C|nr:hybrid sensor histidine kinase/response regulator [uncultured Alistipes sp.]